MKRALCVLLKGTIWAISLHLIAWPLGVIITGRVIVLVVAMSFIEHMLRASPTGRAL